MAPPHSDPPEPDATDPPEPAERLIADRYRLVRELGGGSMGTVWVARDELLRRPVAIKEVRLPPGLPEEEAAELRERALREARAIAVLTHPNVVTLYDVARHHGEPYVVMEFLPSRSLAGLVQEHGPLNAPQLAAITDAVAAALDAAHHAGITHRDVKPGNVLISADGLIKLTDFGISRNIAESTLTNTGIMLGTPAFIAPEVAAGGDASPAADLWGLGATLYAAAVGEPPYNTGDNPMATIHEVVNGPVPRAEVTGPVGEVIDGLMIKDPMRRLSVTEVRQLVHPLLPAADERPFAALVDADGPTQRVRRSSTAAFPAAPSEDSSGKAPPPGEPVQRGSAAQRDTGVGSAGAHPSTESGKPLASEPGPLPFAAPEPEQRPARARGSGRRTLAIAALAVSAILLFALAAAGGFAGTRLLAGRPLLPGQETAPVQRLVARTDSLSYGSTDLGQFTVPVPRDWITFHGQRDGSTLASKSAHFIAPDGFAELEVERFPSFYSGGYDSAYYLRQLPNLATGENDRFLPGPGASPAGATGPEHELHYRVAEPGNAQRSVDARMYQSGGDLWILRVTVPGEEQAAGQDLFNAARDGFRRG